MLNRGNLKGLLLVILLLKGLAAHAALTDNQPALIDKQITALTDLQNQQIQTEINNLYSGTEPEKDLKKIIVAYRPYYDIYLNSQNFYSQQQSVTCHKFQRIDRLIHQNINLASDGVRIFRLSHDYQMAFLHQIRIEILTQLSLLTLQIVDSNAEGGISLEANSSRSKTVTYSTCVSGAKRADFIKNMQKRHMALMNYRNVLSGKFGLNNSTALSDKFTEYQNGLSNRLWVGERLLEGLETYTFFGKIHTYWKLALAAWIFVNQGDAIIKSRSVSDATLSGSASDMVMGQYVFNTPKSPFSKDMDYQNYLDSIETFVSAAPNVDTYMYLLKLIEETNQSVLTEKLDSLQKRLITKHTLKKGKERTANLGAKRVREQ